MLKWFEFHLIERPYSDGQGNILASIEGRRNRPGIDEFSGGGKIYPELPGKVVQRFEFDDTLFVLLDIDTSAINNLMNKNQKLWFQASPKIKQEYNFKDFNPKKLSESEVLGKIKKFYGGIVYINSDKRIVFSSPDESEGNKTIPGS